MVCKLIDSAIVVLKLLKSKVGGIIAISKTGLFNFFGTEKIQQNQKL